MQYTYIRLIVSIYPQVLQRVPGFEIKDKKNEFKIYTHPLPYFFFTYVTLWHVGKFVFSPLLASLLIEFSSMSLFFTLQTIAFWGSSCQPLQSSL